jgi:hypothetical protein
LGAKFTSRVRVRDKLRIRFRARVRVEFRARVRVEVRVRLGLEKCIYPSFHTGKCKKLRGQKRLGCWTLGL